MTPTATKIVTRLPLSEFNGSITKMAGGAECTGKMSSTKHGRIGTGRAARTLASGGVMHHGVIYNVNFKKFNQTAHERNDNGTLKPSRRTRSIRRIMVSHERDSSRPYE